VIDYLVAEHLSDALEERRYLNLEVPVIAPGSPLAMAFPSCFLFHSIFESSQVHPNKVHKFFGRMQKVFPSSPTFGTLKHETQETFLSKQKKKSNSFWCKKS